MEGSESFDKLRMSGENKLKVKNLKPKAENVIRLTRSFASLEDDTNIGADAPIYPWILRQAQDERK
jgi:hypothetical protein